MQQGNRLIIQKLKMENDRYHKKKLLQIRNSKFKQQKSILKINDRKGYLIESQRKQEIEKQNTALLTKMNKINEKKIELNELYSIGRRRSLKIKNTDRNIELQLTKDRILNTKSHYSQQKIENSKRDSQRYKKSFSKQKNKDFSQNELTKDKQLNGFDNEEKIDLSEKRQKELQSQDTIEKQANNQKIKAAKQSFQSAIKIFQNIYQVKRLQLENKSSEDKFTKPQQIFERIVFYKKSVILEDNKNYLIEISAAYKKLFILVFDMQNLKNIQRLIYKQKQFHEILAENNYNFTELAQKIVIHQNSISLKRKYIQRQNDHKESKYSINKDLKEVSLYEKQIQFIKRNFYNKKTQQKVAENIVPIQKVTKKLNTDYIDNKPKAINIRTRFKYESINQKNRNIELKKQNSELTVNLKQNNFINTSHTQIKNKNTHIQEIPNKSLAKQQQQLYEQNFESEKQVSQNKNQQNQYSQEFDQNQHSQLNNEQQKQYTQQFYQHEKQNHQKQHHDKPHTKKQGTEQYQQQKDREVSALAQQQYKQQFEQQKPKQQEQYQENFIHEEQIEKQQNQKQSKNHKNIEQQYQQNFENSGPN